MNIAVIFAGGTGQRMNTRTRPKQFLEVHSKPIIIYTLEVFENSPKIDGIVITCLESWIDYCRELVHRYGIRKVIDIVPGGETGQLSICRGVERAAEKFGEDSIILVHDGVRPLIDQETISSAIECVKKNGSAITVAPAVETITVRTDSEEVGEIIDRSRCCLAKAPQCFYLGELLSAHRKAKQEGRVDFIDSASLMRYYGHTLYTVQGKPENIKITTPSDFYIFRAILDAQENQQVCGV